LEEKSDTSFGAKHDPLIFLLFRLSCSHSSLVPVTWARHWKVFLESAIILRFCIADCWLLSLYFDRNKSFETFSWRNCSKCSVQQ